MFELFSPVHVHYHVECDPLSGQFEDLSCLAIRIDEGPLVERR